MQKPKYNFQRKISFSKRVFKSGLNAAGFILLGLKEINYGLLDAFLPKNYVACRIWREIFGLDPKKEKWKENTIKSNFYRLQKQGLVARDPQKKIYFLTEKGKEFAGYIDDRYSILNQPWDKKIRIVIFDIPEKKRVYRDWLRDELFLLEFKPLQKSVFIGKYPLPNSLIGEMDSYNITPYVFIFTVREIDKKKEVLKILEA
jgi:DNA-binding PadR family transcriptional regulator